MDNERAAGYKKQHDLKMAFECRHKSREKDDHAKRIAAFDHARDILAVERKHERRLERVRLDLGLVTQNIRKPFGLGGDEFRKTVYLERRLVKTVEIGLVYQCEQRVDREKFRQENKEWLVLLEGLQKFFNKFI